MPLYLGPAGLLGRLRWRHLLVASLSSLLLLACGGDDGMQEVVKLPASVSVDVPAGRQALGTPLMLKSSVGTAAEGLSFEWDFGDGQVSKLASPQHSYAAPGVYTVKLVVSNAAGERVTGVASVQVGDLAIAAGRVCSALDQGGWCWQRPLPQGQQLLDFHFASAQRGWAVGEGGAILATADGGKTWTTQYSGTRLALNRVYFVNDSVGWAAGSVGEMLRTLDGGANWQRFSTGQGSAVTALGAIDASVAWFDAGGSTYITSDGGHRWTRLVSARGSSAISVAGATTYWTIEGNEISRTTNGKDWTVVPPLPAVGPNLNQQIYRIQARDARTALVSAYEFGFLDSGFSQYVSRRVGWLTSDGGATWRYLTPTNNYYSDFRLLADGAILESSEAFEIASRTSTDQGQTWSAVRLPQLSRDTYVVKLDVFGAQRMMVRDSAGNRHFSGDGGANWVQGQVGGPIGAGMNSVWFFNSRDGLAISNEGFYLKTADGGLTWTQADRQAGNGWTRLQFLPGAATGWVISYNGTIFKSSDRGKTWLSPVQPTSTPTYGVTDFHFVDAQRGWAVAPFPGYAAASIHMSTDGGSSWQPVASTAELSGLVAIRFADADAGVAVGPPGYAYVTADGGKTWAPRPTGTVLGLRRVTFTNANVAVAVGDNGVIVRSADRGQTWSRVNSPTANTLHDVRFMSSTRGYAVGDGGTLLTTVDGGLTWTLRDTGVSLALRAVYFVDAYTGWVVGDGGAILVTTDGG